MDVAKGVTWGSGQTVCRCCLSEGCYKDISSEYFWMGKREVYSEMLSDTFDVNIGFPLNGGSNSTSRLICELCITRLRDASEFKRQVLDCEKVFTQHLEGGSSQTCTVDIEEDKHVKMEVVKTEKLDSDHDHDDGDEEYEPDMASDDDDLDDEPLTKFATKVPKKESEESLLDLLEDTKPAKRKVAAKAKASPAKKVKVTKKDLDKPSTSSKAVAKVDKKKKDVSVREINVVRWNAEIIVKFTTAYPFRLPGNQPVCLYCNESFSDAGEFRRHMEEQHTTFSRRHVFAHVSPENYLKLDCTELSCRICKEKFAKLDLIANHLKVDHRAKLRLENGLDLLPYVMGPGRMACGICEVNQPGYRQLGRHLASHFHNFTCESCGKSYINLTSLRQHTQHCSKVKTYQCWKCRKEFESMEKRREHVEQTKYCWRYCCDICGERFIKWPLREEHMITVHNRPSRTYNCAECGEVFDCQRGYRKHFRIVHSGDEYRCEYCGKGCESKKCLDEHLVTHTKEKNYTCEVCLKGFGTKKNLIQHSWIHNDFKRFECKMCDKKFNQRVSWKTHMKSHHPQLVDF